MPYCNLELSPQAADLDQLDLDSALFCWDHSLMNCLKRIVCSRCFQFLAFFSLLCFGMYHLFRGGANLKHSATQTYQFNISFARKVLSSLCQLYRRNEVSGDYCNRLCFYGNYTFVDFFVENKVVLVLLTGGQKVVLKSQHPYFTEFDQLPDSLSRKQFEEKVLEVANYHLELGWPSDRRNHLLELLWPASIRSDELSLADRKSLWALISQEEYLTFSVLNLARVFPKIMGSCGHFYAVEHLVPFRLKSYYTNLKAKILVHLMGTLKLFYEFLNEPLHWCDVKFENFGLSADYPKRFLVMDADMIFTETRMHRLLENLGCKSDADCQFFDCQAKCNKSNNHCTRRINDNVDDEAQGFHWNNAQATIHPFVCYCKDDEELKQLSFVVISNCLTHNTTAVHLFQRHLMTFLERKLGQKPKKVIYFSDGASSHYKNFINLCYHEEDFGSPAEWHFFATSRGKGPCDGVGGSVKGLAAQASLQRPYQDQIMTPLQLYDFANAHIGNISFYFSTTVEHEAEEERLEERFRIGKCIEGTQKLHSFHPVSLLHLKAKIYSSSPAWKEVKVSDMNDIPLADIRGFVTAVYEGEWYLGCVLQTFPDTQMVRVSFLHPAGPAPFWYPTGRQDILDVPACDILTTLTPSCPTGRVYTMTEKEKKEASRCLNLKK